ncbi:MAG: nucleoside triphosphate pyrophosphohydrolase [Sphingobium sp.]|jgi:ATP diphosphatase|nr:nucleoside triphosphate pyrophosphohydrolase [Sphingobium sp.]MCI1272187.1 nucleoside triphosphate pyrophosphohydrolase [Sphingobium sp.]MCI1755917.1 nucleoside triphosphate pyrophosphohydrolase [Sphingobium sp.]MCI2052282.1 nucleoside triphosphate pyrophosphohydrolase [Sphingobium sp.]
MPDRTPPDIAPLVAIMARLRDPASGCPWDVQQNFASIAPYTIEEAYEVADAISRNDMADLRDELGDLLLQTVYHSRMAEESGHFALTDVIAGICDKMIRRHPHVFGPEDAQTPGWEAIKAAERADKDADSSALAGVAGALPALLRAEKLQKRAARTGFDWPDTDGVYAKIAEELEEVRAAETAEHRAEEIGDLLFAVVNLARHMKVDAESALRAANAKFERRFRSMEMSNTRQDIDFMSLSLDEMEALWQQAKAEE